jgi:2-C-methyl-D-erythritol 4-phosphate cytidylyltransferase
MNVQAIIPCAGLGKRLQSAFPKSLIFLNGKPLCIYALEVMERCPRIDAVIVAAPKAYLPQFQSIIQKYRLKKVKVLVAGGRTRCESVRKALEVLSPETEVVVIHDGARPFVSLHQLEEMIALTKRYPAVIAALPVKPTVKRIHLEKMFVEETLPREELWEVQTPQVFRKEVLLKAHKRNKDNSATDDALLVERLGIPVKVVRGQERNVKITTPQDFLWAQVFLSYNK